VAPLADALGDLRGRKLDHAAGLLGDVLTRFN